MRPFEEPNPSMKKREMKKQNIIGDKDKGKMGGAFIGNEMFGGP